jgi:hypothetical protein
MVIITNFQSGSCSPSGTPCGYVDLKTPQKGYHYEIKIVKYYANRNFLLTKLGGSLGSVP